MLVSWVTVLNRPHLFVPALIAGLVAVASLVGCSGDDEPKSAKAQLQEMGITEEPALVVASAVQRLDPSAVIGLELGRSLIRMKYVQSGYSWSDTVCVADRVVEAFGENEFSKLTVIRLGDVIYDRPELPAAIRTCASPESLARLDKKAEGSPAPSADAPAEMANDIDGAEVGVTVEAFLRMSADRIDLNDEETACVVGGLVGGRDAADFVALATGEEVVSVGDIAALVTDCLGKRRLDVVAPKAGRALLDAKEVSAENDLRVQRLIDEQFNQQPASTTTAP